VTKLSGPRISLIASLIVIVLAELCLRLLLPVPDPYERLKTAAMGLNQYIKSEFPQNFRLHTEAEEGLPGVAGKNVFTINNMGFRGDDLQVPKPGDEYRIFMVGGSSTESLYLDDSQAVTHVLEEELHKRLPKSRRVKVYNAGKSGDASDDHVSMIVHRIVHLQPDMIILFSGLNDLTRSIYHYDYLHYARPARLERRFSSSKLLKFLLTEFQIPRRIYYLVERVTPQSEEGILEEITARSNYKKKVQLRLSVPVSDQEPRTDLAAYEHNLRTIVGVAIAHRTRLTMVTQATTWNSSVDPRTAEWQWVLYRNGVHYRADRMDAALESLNNVMRKLAIEFSVPLYDLANRVPKSLEFFYDDVHFNVRGARKVGTELAAFLVEKDLIRRSVQ
jgi:lysophospholipase L1-like esterase